MKFSNLIFCALSGLILLGNSFVMKADEPFRKHRFSSFQSLPICQEGDVVFIGNSITHMLDWYEALGNKYNVHGRGNSGGYAEEVHSNLQSMIAGNPSKVFLMIGTNNLGSNQTAYDTPEKLIPLLKEILTDIRIQVPDADVYYQSILPTLVGTRTRAKTEATNNGVKEWIESKNDDKLHYVDLYSKFVKESDGSLDNSIASQSQTSFSYDGLHLTQKGYKLWLDEILPLLGEDYECVFPEEAVNLWGGLNASSGMRTTYFGASPTYSDDILIFGDENINSGEWHELLGSSDFKNRGNGWDYTTAVLSAMAGDNYFQDALRGNIDNGVERQDPKAVIISAGAYEIQKDPQSTVFNTYVKAVEKLRSILPETPVFVCTLPPASNSGFETKTIEFNENLKSTYGNDNDNIYVIDIYSSMMNNGARDHDCFMGKGSSATNSFYLSGKGYVKFAQKIAEVINEKLGTDYQAVTDEEMEENLRLFEVLSGIYNDKPNVGNPGEPISGDQIDLFYELLPEIRAKLTRGKIAEFFEDLEYAYEYARNEAEPAPEIPYVTKKIMIEPQLENGNFYRSDNGSLSLQQPWPYSGTFLGIEGNCFLVAQWESKGGEIKITATANNSPGEGYNNNLWYFENEGFAASGNPNATIDDPYIYAFSAGDNYTIKSIHFKSKAMTDADQIWIYEDKQFIAKVGEEGVDVDLTGLNSQEVWIGLVGQNKGASMTDFYIELSEMMFEDENTLIISPKSGTTYSVINGTGDKNQETDINAGIWISHNEEVGLTLRGKNTNGGFNNIFNSDKEWLTLNNGNSSIDIIYEIECNKGYVITGVYAELVPVTEEVVIPWDIEGQIYIPSIEGTPLELTGLDTSVVRMNPGDETTHPIYLTYFKNFYVTVRETSAVEGITQDKINAPEIFYDLQGRRVNNPSNGIFIRRKGNKADKIIIR